MNIVNLLKLLFPKQEKLSHDDDLSANFKVGELLHPSTKWQDLTREQRLNIRRLVGRLERLRVLFNTPFIINTSGRRNAGFRTPEQNRFIGGATKSYHMKGMAADIAVPKGDIRRVALTAQDMFGGVILYEEMNFIHLDLRDLEGKVYHPEFDFR